MSQQPNCSKNGTLHGRQSDRRVWGRHGTFRSEDRLPGPRRDAQHRTAEILEWTEGLHGIVRTFDVGAVRHQLVDNMAILHEQHDLGRPAGAVRYTFEA